MATSNPGLEPAVARQRLTAMSPEARNSLVEEFIREEVLYREALSLGLDRDDYARRRQLIDRLLWISDAWAGEATGITDAELAAWYQDHQDNYREPTRYSFAHIYLGPRAAESDTTALRQKLNAQGISFNQAGEYGQRFLYHRYYVDRSPDEVAAHFGARFVDDLTRLNPDPINWQGPVTSDHGQHLVLLRRTQPAELPPLEQIRARVSDDILAARIAEARGNLFLEARSGYTISVAEELTRSGRTP